MNFATPQSFAAILGLTLIGLCGSALAADCGFPSGDVQDVLALASGSKASYKYSEKGRHESIQFSEHCSEVAQEANPFPRLNVQNGATFFALHKLQLRRADCDSHKAA